MNEGNSTPRRPSSQKRAISAVRYLVGVAIFSALAYAVGTLCEAFMPKVLFLSIDMKDAVITIGAFIFGPLAAIPMSVISVFLQSVTLGFPTGPIGMLQDFVSTLVFSLVASLIYNKWRNIKGMVTGFSATTLAYVAVMIPMNILLTPIFTGAPRSMIIDLLPTVFIPFNFAKSLLDSAVCLLLYKPISGALSASGLIKRKETPIKINSTFFVTLTVAVILVAVTTLIFLLIINLNKDLVQG